jgi:hypothetical protein
MIAPDPDDLAKLIAPDEDITKISTNELVTRRMLPDWRIRRAKLIDSAIGIIKPNDATRDACREDVARITLGLMGEKALLSGKNQIHTKDGKLAAAQLASALRRVEAALKHPDLDSGLRGIFAWRFPADKVQNFTEDCEHYAS